MRGTGGRGAHQVQGNLVSLDNQSPAAKRKLQWSVAKRKAPCDIFCKWTGSPVDLLALFISQKKQLNRSVNVMQNQTKCERSMPEIISISRNCTHNEIIVVNHLASCWCAAHQQKAGNVTLGWQWSISSQLGGGGASNLANHQLWFNHPFSTTDWLKAQRTGQQRQRQRWWTSGSAEPGNVTLWWTHARAAGRSPKSHRPHLRHHCQHHFHRCRHHQVSLFGNPTGSKLSLFSSFHNFPCSLPAIKHDQPVFLSTHHLNMFGSSLSLSELYATAAVATFPFFFFAVSSCPSNTGCVVFAFLLQMCYNYVLFMFLLLTAPLFLVYTGDCILLCLRFIARMHINCKAVANTCKYALCMLVAPPLAQF